MNIKVQRHFQGETYTIGALSVDGTYLCDTLEDKVRKVGEPKIYGRTAIPAGKYKVMLWASPKFKRWLPKLVNVPGFDGILMHRGNTDIDTSGCILVGENKIKGKVINSTVYELKLVEMCRNAYKKREEIWIEVC